MNPAQVLIIDDDPIFVKSTKAILEANGYQVDSAPGGDEGLAKIKASKPDLVLLDVMMDWILDGVSVSRDMMKEPELRDIPIVMVTAIKDSEYKGSFPQDDYLHINSWLDKPVSPDELIAEVKKTLARHAK
ncbi:MAG: response regulator [Anaerolineae bacterium]|nr:response regulator [Anaerolineae bacterium]